MGSLKINKFCIASTTFVIIDDFYAGNKIKSRASILSQQYIYIKIFSIACVFNENLLCKKPDVFPCRRTQLLNCN